MIYAIATGRAPFRAETPFGILRRITDTAARPMRELNSELPVWLEIIVDRLHAKAPADRYGSAGEVAILLRSCLAHVQTPSMPLPNELMPRKSILSRRAGFILAAVLCGCAALFIYSYTGSSTQKTTAIPSNEPTREFAWDEWEGTDPSAILHETERLRSLIKSDGW